MHGSRWYPNLRLVMVSICAVVWCAVAVDRVAADLLYFADLHLRDIEAKVAEGPESEGSAAVDWGLVDNKWYGDQLGEAAVDAFGMADGGDHTGDVSGAIREALMTVQKSPAVFRSDDVYAAYLDLYELDGLTAIEEDEWLSDDGLIVDQTQFVGDPGLDLETGLAEVAGSELSAGSVINGSGRRRAALGGMRGTGTGMIGTAVAQQGSGGRKRLKTFAPLGDTYFLDWPWSTRPGRNMFFWIVGPPAFVFLSLLVMAVFNGPTPNR